jgi:hypothetical protein
MPKVIRFSSSLCTFISHYSPNTKFTKDHIKTASTYQNQREIHLKKTHVHGHNYAPKFKDKNTPQNSQKF